MSSFTILLIPYQHFLKMVAAYFVNTNNSKLTWEFIISVMPWMTIGISLHIFDTFSSSRYVFLSMNLSWLAKTWRSFYTAFYFIPPLVCRSTMMHLVVDLVLNTFLFFQIWIWKRTYRCDNWMILPRSSWSTCTLHLDLVYCLIMIKRMKTILDHKCAECDSPLTFNSSKRL